MDNRLDNETKQQIAQCLNLLKEVFGKELLGVYLYGSLIVGGLQKYSDVDIFVITNRPSSKEEKTKIATSLLNISGIYQKTSKRPIEMTIVVKSAVNPWHYPSTFDFQYGDWLREKFEGGNIEPWDSKVMPDLALLITQVLLASKKLSGEEPDKLLDKVSYRDFITAATEEIDSLLTNIDSDTRNVLLTLARIWITVETDSISSKPAAASWAINKLPKKYQPVLQRAKAVYLGEENENWEDLKNQIRSCANFMVTKIKERVSLINFEDSTKSIQLIQI